MEKPLQVFCCYARKDQELLHELKKRLKPLQYRGLITIHDDIDVSPGEDWEQKITHDLNTADIILLLVSPDFIASEYCYGREMKIAIERHNKGEAHVIPVILRPVHLQDVPFGTIQSLPTNARPITRWPDPDDAFLDVKAGIEKTIEALISRKKQPPPPPPDKPAEDYNSTIGEAIALRSLKRYNEALTAFDQAIRLDPRSVYAHVGRGRILNELKRYSEALTAFDQAIRLDPRSSIAYDNKGHALHSLQRYKEAEEAYQKARDLERSDIQ